MFHLLDVAAAADAILSVRRLALERGAQLLGLEPDAARRLLVALVALHDLGKFGVGFQAKRPDLWPAVLGDPCAAPASAHTVDGFILWRDSLENLVIERLWPNGREVLSALAPAIFGHHGRPPVPASMPASHRLGLNGVRAAEACASAVLDVLHPDPLDAACVCDVSRARVASWWVSGLVTVADWVGSHEEWFPFEMPRDDIALDLILRNYWRETRVRAEEAMRNAGLIPTPSAPARVARDFTSGRAPTPAQAWAEKVAIPRGPLLILLEDVTGAGKTEAAQILVHRLMADSHATGAYWAMPTQATANAMYERQREMLPLLYAPDGAQVPSLVLMHGQARLHERFRSTVLGTAGRLAPRDTRPHGDDDSEVTSVVACAAFLADDRRTSFLADLGAGTIDQAVLGVLPSKFNTVRILGLVDKVLVLDEAHAYDAHVNEEMFALLRFQAALGGSAIVLSATLARQQREDVVTAWDEGLTGRSRVVLFGGQPAPRVHSAAYPLATLVASPEEIHETPLTAASWSRRTVPIRWVHEQDTALDRIVEAASTGAAVAWVRNTVKDCLHAAAALEERGVHATVFHARFAQVDRQRRESEVVHRFGKRSEPAERRGVLIATQVIEQSLDLDFDVLLTDLAPVDLLIQRLGRLWRHAERDPLRPSGLMREMIVLAPPFEADPPEQWISELLPGTAAVYREVGLLWRTVRALAAAGAIEAPGKRGHPRAVRTLVERVYGDSDVPSALAGADGRARGESHAAASAARYGVRVVTDGYHGSAQGWLDEIRMPTRLGREQTTIRLAQLADDGTLVPWADDPTTDWPVWKRWALSEVRVSSYKVPRDAAVAARLRPAVDALRGEWSKYDQELVVLPLVQQASDGWDGTLFKADGALIEISYSTARGLVVR